MEYKLRKPLKYDQFINEKQFQLGSEYLDQCIQLLLNKMRLSIQYIRYSVFYDPEYSEFNCPEIRIYIESTLKRIDCSIMFADLIKSYIYSLKYSEDLKDKILHEIWEFKIIFDYIDNLVDDEKQQILTDSIYRIYNSIC